MSTRISFTNPSLGFLGLTTVQGNREINESNREDLSARYFKDAGNYTLAQSLAMKIFNQAEANVLSTSPHLAAEIDGSTFSSLVLLQKPELFHSGIYHCLALANSEETDVTTATEVISYIEALIGAYSVFQTTDTSTQESRESFLNVAPIILQEQQLLAGYMAMVANRHVGTSADLYDRSASIHTRLRAMIVGLHERISQVKNTPLPTPEPQTPPPPPASPPETNPHPVVAPLKPSKTKELKAITKARHDMSSQLDAAEVVLKLVEDIQPTLEIFEAGPQPATKVVSIYESLKTKIASVKTLSETAHRLTSRYASYEREKSPIGDGPETEALVTKLRDLRSRWEALETTIDTATRLLFKPDPQRPLISTEGTPVSPGPVIRPLTDWCNYPDISIVVQDTTFIQVIQETGISNDVWLRTPEVLLFAPDHMVQEPHYRRSYENNPDQYLPTRIRAMVDGLNAFFETKPEDACWNEPDFVTKYCAAFNAFNADAGNYTKVTDHPFMNLRKEIWKAIFNNEAVHQKFLEKIAVNFLEAQSWITEEAADLVSLPIAKTDELSTFYTPYVRSILPTLSAHYNKEGLELSRAIQDDLSTSSEIAPLFMTFYWMPLLASDLRAQFQADDIHSLYLLMGMRPVIDRDETSVWTDYHKKQRDTFAEDIIEPTAGDNDYPQMRTILKNAHILTTPKGSFLLLGDNPKLQSLRDDIARGKQTSITEDVTLEVITVDQPNLVRIAAWSELSDEEQDRTGYKDLMDRWTVMTDRLTAMTNIFAYHLVERNNSRYPYHQRLWREAVRCIVHTNIPLKDPNKTLRAQLTEWWTHYGN